MKRIVSIVIVISVILGLQVAYAASDNKILPCRNRENR